MIGWLRELSRRRITDRDRRRMFWLLATGVLATAALLLATRPGPQHPTHVDHTHAGVSAKPADQPAAPPSPSAPPVPATRVARAFFAGYLPLLYGQSRSQRRRLVDATTGLRHALTAGRLVVPPAQRRRHPRVLSLTAIRAGAGWRVTALIADGGFADYPIVLTLVRGRGGEWLVGEVGGR